MKIWYENEIDVDACTVTATSEVSTLPASNLKHDFRKKVFRSNSTPVTFNIVFDLGTAALASSCFILDHTIDPDAQIFIEASADNFATTPFSAEIDWVDDFMVETFTNITYRYWRLRITLVTGVPIFEIGRVFIGDHVTLTDPPEFEDYGHTFNDPSRIQTTLGGQQYVEEVEKSILVDLSWKHARQATFNELEALNAYAGKGRSFVVQVDVNLDPMDDYLYVRQETELKADVSVYTDTYQAAGELLWNIGMRLREQV